MSLESLACPWPHCQWNGPVKIFEHHCGKDHPTSRMTNYRKFVIEEGIHAYLMVHAAKNFVIKLNQKIVEAGDAKLLHVTLSVAIIGTRRDAAQFAFDVSVQNGTWKQTIISTQPISGFLENNIVCVQFTLIVVNNELFYNKNRVKHFYIVLKPATPTSDLNAIKTTILKRLQCPNCSTVIKSPVYQCENGHLICDTCLPQIVKCHVCEACPTFIRNTFAESIAQEITITCSNAPNGCTYTSPLHHIQQHEAHCTFGAKPCPVGHLHTDCTWTGPVKDIISHVRQEHVNRTLEELQVVVHFRAADFSIGQEDAYVFEYNGDVFRLLYKYERQVFHWAVQLIGPSADFEKYKYVLSFGREGGNNFAMRYPCLPYSAVDAVVMWMRCSVEIVYYAIDDGGNLVYKIQMVGTED